MKISFISVFKWIWSEHLHDHVTCVNKYSCKHPQVCVFFLEQLNFCTVAMNIYRWTQYGWRWSGITRSRAANRYNEAYGCGVDTKQRTQGEALTRTWTQTHHINKTNQSPSKMCTVITNKLKPSDTDDDWAVRRGWWVL